MVKINITDIEDSRNQGQPGAVEAIAQIITSEIDKGNAVMVVREYSNAPEDYILTIRNIQELENFIRPYNV